MLRFTTSYFFLLAFVSCFGQQYTYPEPVGGFGVLSNKMASEMQYPQFAYENDKDGPVYVSFLIDEKGFLFDFIEWSSPHSSLTNEARRMIDMEFKWVAGTVNGVKDTSQINFVFLFQLHAGGYSYDKSYFEKKERQMYLPYANYTSSLVVYKAHSEKVPSFSDDAFKSQYLLAMDLMKQKKYSPAYAELKTLYPRDAKNHEVLFQLALCAHELGKHKAACRYLNKAIVNGNPQAPNFTNSICPPTE